MFRLGTPAFLATCLAGLAAAPARAQDVAFEVSSPEKIDVAWHARDELAETITVRNSGKDASTTISIVASRLQDATTMRTIDVVAKPLGPCAPGRFCPFVIPIPRSAYAGTFSGAIVIDADGRVRRSVPIVVRSRGPKSFLFVDESGWPRLAPRLPALLFWIVVAVGYTVSSILDWWFAGGGRRRYEARRLLARTRGVLTGNLVRVTAWQQRFGPQTMAKTVGRWHLALVEIERVDENAAGMPIADLETAVTELAALANCSNVLWRALTIATERFESDLNQLLAIAQRLDAIEPLGDLKAYRTACQKALEPAGATEQVMRPSATLFAARVGPLVPAFMNWLYMSVAWIVVGAIAYLTFYDRAWSFGTARDYINVFLWTLGLTQTGTQILNRAKSSQTRL